MRSLTLVRRIAARPSIVFEAMTTAEGVAAWWGPDAVPVVHAEIDARVGGGYRVHFRTLDGLEHLAYGEYLQLVPGEIARLGSHSFMILGRDDASHIIAEHRSGTPPHNYQILLRVRLDKAEMDAYERIAKSSKTLPAHILRLSAPIGWTSKSTMKRRSLAQGWLKL
jgi:hypothetical protein